MALIENDSPLVTVVIPVYNASPFIKQGYEQIIHQDYEHLEIIFVDNNSSDDTVCLIQNLSKLDKRIKLIHERKQGAGAARNAGIKQASGKIISFFDIDDLLEPDKISEHVRILSENTDVDLVFGKVKKWYPDSDYSYIIPENIFSPGVIQPYRDAIHWIRHFSNLPSPSSCTCLKNAALMVDGFEESLKRGEDAAFLIKIALNCKMYFENRVVATYVRHPDSTVSMDNAVLSGNPYYYQHKTFFLPYLNDFAQKVMNKRVAHLASQKTLYSLNDHLHKLSKNPAHRLKLCSVEVKELILKGYPVIFSILSLVLSVVPVSISRFLLKVYDKCFSINTLY
jgi:glycosyltransferase involved in cell wall biosynthesis